MIYSETFFIYIRIIPYIIINYKMEGLLIKVDDVYRLIHEQIIIGTTDADYQKAFSDHCAMLSVKNCQDVEIGVDLDELANKYGKDDINDDIYFSFIAGAKTILELLKDKKYTEKDMHKAFEAGVLEDRYDLGEALSSPNEWKVTFNPVLVDTNGCLMLRRL